MMQKSRLRTFAQSMPLAAFVDCGERVRRFGTARATAR